MTTLELLARLIAAVATIVGGFLGLVQAIRLWRKASIEERRALRSRQLARLRRQLRLKEIELEKCHQDRDRAERSVTAYEKTNVQFWGQE